jgi:antitoxin component YwqK of YwqJK toxin-antitoxin module
MNLNISHFKSISLLIFFGFQTACFAQEMNQTDGANGKFGQWIYYGKDDPAKEYCDSCKVREGYYKDNKKEGYWTEYYSNGSIRLLGHYTNNRPNGSFVKYYENGFIRESGNFLNKTNNYYGLYLRYHSNGNLKSIQHFDDLGNEVDTASYYSKSGIITKTYIYDTINDSYTEMNYFQDGCPKDTLIVTAAQRREVSDHKKPKHKNKLPEYQDPLNLKEEE